MSKTYYRDVSLDQAIGRAGHILRVEKEKPFTTQKEIRIEKDGTLLHQYTLMEFHFKVTKVIHGRSRYYEPVTGASIVVYPAYSIEKIHLSRLYYLEGIGKSPVYDCYKSSIDFDISDEMIIFIIRKDDGTFEFSCEYGYEAVKREKEILEILEKNK